MCGGCAEDATMKKRLFAAALAVLVMVSTASCGIITIRPAGGSVQPDLPAKSEPEVLPAAPTEPEKTPDRFTVAFAENETFSNEAARKAAEHIDPAIRSAVRLLNTIGEDTCTVLDCDYSLRPTARDGLENSLSVELYDTILESVSSFEDLTVNEKNYGSSFFSDFVAAQDALKVDHRKLFLYCDLASQAYKHTTVYYMPGDWMDTPCDDREAIRQEVAVFDAVVDRIMDKMPEGLTNYQKCCYFAFVIAMTAYYDQNYDTKLDSFQEYNTLVKNTGVCQGYARAFALLCREAGIDCRYCEGIELVMNVNHAWNLLKTTEGDVIVDVTYYDTDVDLNDESWLDGDFPYLFMPASGPGGDGRSASYQE